MLPKLYAFLIMLLLVLTVRLYPYGQVLGSHAETVIALGFVMLSGYIFGELVSRLALPRITGYLFAGILLGPYLGGVIQMRSVDDLELINGIALALIALSAGGELHLNELRRDWKGVAAISLFQTGGVMVLIGILFYCLAGGLPFFESVQMASLVGACALFGIIAVSQSPAVTIAIISETKAKGQTAEIALGVAVIRDILVIVGFSIGLSVVINLETGEGGLGGDTFLTLGWEIVLSMVVGIATGWLLTWYLKYIRSNPVLFLLAFCYLISEGSHTFHLDPVIVCVAAGVWVSNASKLGQGLMDTIESGSLLIYVVFFCVAGAALDLNALVQMWGIALILVLVRVFLMFLTTQLALKVSGLQVADPKTFWMAFLPQAGVSLGLVSLLGQKPIAWAEGFMTLLVAYIAVNQIIGPIPTKIAFQRAGEVQAKEKT